MLVVPGTFEAGLEYPVSRQVAGCDGPYRPGTSDSEMSVQRGDPQASCNL